VEQVVIVKPMPDAPMLNIDSLLFVERGQKLLGKVIDVYGHVNEAYYCICFNNSEHIEKHNIEIDATVYYCPKLPYTLLLYPRELKRLIF